MTYIMSSHTESVTDPNPELWSSLLSFQSLVCLPTGSQQLPVRLFLIFPFLLSKPKSILYTLEKVRPNLTWWHMLGSCYSEAEEGRQGHRGQTGLQNKNIRWKRKTNKQHIRLLWKLKNLRGERYSQSNDFKSQGLLLKFRCEIVVMDSYLCMSVFSF